MDETTLTRTLLDLAADAPLHPEPSADARRRASKLRRARRTVAAGLVAVVAIAVVGGVELEPAAKSRGASTATSWVKELTDPHNPNHATTGYIGVPRAAGGQWIVYWQGHRLCYEAVAASGVTLGSDCSVPVSTPTSIAPAMATESNGGNRTLGADDGGGFYAVAPGVTIVGVSSLPAATVAFPAGVTIPVQAGDGVLAPVEEADFPAHVVVAEGTVLSLHVEGEHGQQVGAAIPGPAAPQLRQVLATFDCPGTGMTGFDLIVPDRGDPKTCYGLAPAAMTFVPKSAEAIDDATQGWLVQITMNDRDAATFGSLTQRITVQTPPMDQLAFVFDGKVQSAPTFQSAITGGVFQITGGTGGITKLQAQELAGQMGE